MNQHLSIISYKMNETSVLKAAVLPGKWVWGCHFRVKIGTHPYILEKTMKKSPTSIPIMKTVTHLYTFQERMTHHYTQY